MKTKNLRTKTPTMENRIRRPVSSLMHPELSLKSVIGPS